ncbi:MAG: 2-C-methyl-D-erythritol 2,4-cyclodiphosphate synthase [Bacteroidetes bacterium]|nr:2-C-methyl-D-erythritol 2,4-cyclodiphosphate synthase [Bacteroidota bacterium]
MPFRIGFGIDVHRLEKGREFWLGGVLIPSELGAVGHSDADALIHAICDAMLGAAGLRDIGFYFPDSDPALKGIDSKLILKKILTLIKEEGYSIGNIDTTVCLQTPKIAQYIGSMQSALSEILGIPAKKLGIKATTTEKLGFEGRSEGITCYAVVLLEKLSD